MQTKHLLRIIIDNEERYYAYDYDICAAFDGDDFRFCTHSEKEMFEIVLEDGNQHLRMLTMKDLLLPNNREYLIDVLNEDIEENYFIRFHFICNSLDFI